MNDLTEEGMSKKIDSAWERFLRNRAGIMVPVIAFGGILISLAVVPETIFSQAGVWGCVLASFLLALLAYLKPKKDIVSLLTPLYAVLIFGNPDFSGYLLLQILYAASLTVLVLRLNARFSRGDEPRRITTANETEEFEDEKVSE